MKEDLKGKFVQYTIEPETDNRLFFVTDIHGQYDLLIKALDLLDFIDFPNPKQKQDILISLGDMCDRGAKSLDVLSMFRYSQNKKSLRGNHEDIMYDGTRVFPVEGISRNSIIKGSSRVHWEQQGGSWVNQHDFSAVRDYANWAHSLPLVGEIHTQEHIIGITHAEVIPTEINKTGYTPDWYEETNINWDHSVLLAEEMTDNEKDCIKNQALKYAFTWCREPIRRNISLNVKGVDAVLHGHSIVSYKPVVMGNCIYFDNGSFLATPESEEFSLNILEYAPSQDSILGLFKLHQFYFDSNKMVQMR